MNERGAIKRRFMSRDYRVGDDSEPEWAFSVGCEGEAKWRRLTANRSGFICALCFRHIGMGEPCFRAQYRASRGVYIQVYHPNCAYVTQTNEAAVRALRNPGEVGQWARDHTCLKCDRWGRCLMNPFDCERAVGYLRLMGGK